MKKGLAAVLLFSALNWAVAGAPAKGPREDKGQGKEKAVRQEAPAEKGEVKSTGKSEENPPVSEAKGKAAEQDLDKGKGKAEEMKGKGKDQAQQAAAVQKKLVHEEQKHLRRRARIQRILELAKEKGDEKTAARAQKLLDKEQGRFDKKHTRLSEGAGPADKPTAETGKKPMPKKEKKSSPRAAEENESEE